MPPWPGDHVATRDLYIGRQNERVPLEHPTCTVCGCDCEDFRFEAFGFLGHPNATEYVLIRTCMAHWHAQLAARLRAAEV